MIFHPRLTLVLLGPLLAACAHARDMVSAPRMDVPPVNQLAVAGNACGPAALLNSFQSGNDAWRRTWDGVTGNTDRERILTVIREIGMRPSGHSTGRARWSRRGVSVADLRDMAEEMSAGRFLPQPADEVFFRKPTEAPERLLERVRHQLAKSLAKGLPPVLSVRRQAWRAEKANPASWVTVDAHFVTITSVPRKLSRGERSFPVTYIDPWGGRRLSGEIRLPQEALFADSQGRTSCLEAWFPQSSVGSKSVRRGEKTVVIVAAGIGRW